MKGKSTDSCGCALGAKCMAIAMVLSIGYYLWKLHAGQTTLATGIVRIALISFGAAAAGKITGISLYHLNKKLSARKTSFR